MNNFHVTRLVVSLLTLAMACLGQQIKKKTELVLPQDKMAFEVAEAKNNNGNGNGTGLTILRGIAAAGGNPVPLPEDHSSDPNWDPNTDITVGLDLKPGMRCYARKGATATVLRVDGTKVLVEVGRAHYFYAGPRRGSALIPAVASGTLTFNLIEDTPACLNKIKLWIDRDVFVALQAMRQQ